MPRQYWLFKSEPESFSIDDLMNAPDRTTGWDGVRNYQARNFLRDSVQVGDGVLYYHSNADPSGVAGVAVVVRAGHPDPSAFDPTSTYHDPRSDPANPTWFQVAIQGVKKVEPLLDLARLRLMGGKWGVRTIAVREDGVVFTITDPKHCQTIFARSSFRPNFADPTEVHVAFPPRYLETPTLVRALFKMLA